MPTMMNHMSKYLAAPALCAALYGCVSIEPPLSPEAAAAAQAAYAEIDWGILTPYISQQYISDDHHYLAIHPDPVKGELVIEFNRTHRDIPYTKIRFFLKPTETLNTYLVTVPPRGWSGSQTGRIRLDDQGRAHILDPEALGDFEFQISGQKLAIRYDHFKNWELQRDIYFPPSGEPIAVSYDPDSEFQRMRAGKPFGMWEDHIGKTYVGEDIGHMVTVGKDAEGNLELKYTYPNSTRWNRHRVSPPPDMRVLQATEMDNARSLERTSLNNTDVLWLSYVDDDILFGDRGKFEVVMIPRGDRILRTGLREFAGYERQQIYGTYVPVTPEGIQAAAEYNKEQARADEWHREREAARAERNQNMTVNAVMAGLASGFAQGQQTADRLEQKSQNFEMGLKRRLQDIDRRNKARAAIANADGSSKKTGGSSQPQGQTVATPVNTGTPGASSTSVSSTTQGLATPGNVATDVSSAAAAASSPQTASSAQQSPSPVPSYTPTTGDSRMCRNVDDGEKKGYGYGPTRDSAEQKASAGMCINRGPILISMQCREEKQTMKVPVPGNPLKFTQEERPSIWHCSSTFRCQQPKQVCEGSSRGVRQ
jgi:hypothetical protein